MRHLTTLALLLLVPLLQDDETDREVPTWSLGVDERNEEMMESLQGMWQLTSIERPPLAYDPRFTVGNMLIHEGFLCLEIHSILRGLDDYDGVMFQTGMHRFELTARGTLRTQTMIGTNNIDGEGALSFEQPGRRREFTVIHSDDLLSLERLEDNARLNFRRIRWQPKKRRDFYGRVIPDEEESEGEDPDEDSDER